MGRTGITQHEVSRAAQELLDKGIAPTIDNVREALGGTGSKTTISKYVRIWKEGQPHSTSSTLPGSVLTAMEGAYEQLKAESFQSAQELEARYTDQLDACSQQVEAAQQQGQKLAAINAEQAVKLTRLTTELEALKPLNQQLEMTLGQITAERDVLQQRLEERDDYILDKKTEIERLHRQQRHFEEMTAANHEAEIGRFQAELNQLRQERDTATTERDHGRAENQALAVALRSAETQQTELAAENTTLSHQATQRLHDISQANERMQTLEAQVSELQTENTQYRESQIRLRSENDQLSAKNTALKKATDQQSSDIERLRVDLSNALQEKAILQGQHQQLEKMWRKMANNKHKDQGANE